MRLGRRPPPPPRAGATLAARLFTRPGCHLCEWAQADLERLQASVPHTLEVVDIALDPDLLRRYGERIPVLAIGAREIDAPLPYAVLERALLAARADAARPAVATPPTGTRPTGTRPRETPPGATSQPKGSEPRGV